MMQVDGLRDAAGFLQLGKDEAVQLAQNPLRFLALKSCFDHPSKLLDGGAEAEPFPESQLPCFAVGNDSGRVVQFSDALNGGGFLQLEKNERVQLPGGLPP